MTIFKESWNSFNKCHLTSKVCIYLCLSTLRSVTTNQLTLIMYTHQPPCRFFPTAFPTLTYRHNFIALLKWQWTLPFQSDGWISDPSGWLLAPSPSSMAPAVPDAGQISHDVVKRAREAPESCQTSPVSGMQSCPLHVGTPEQTWEHLCCDSTIQPLGYEWIFS